MPGRDAAARLPHDFRCLLAAACVSQAGTQVSLVAMPLVAVITLHATTFQAGLISTADTAAFLLIGLPAGAWVDRLRRRPVLVCADAARAVLVGTVPVAAALGVLGLPQFYGVALAVGLVTVLFDVAHMSYVPFLAGKDHLMAGNAGWRPSSSRRSRRARRRRAAGPVGRAPMPWPRTGPAT